MRIETLPAEIAWAIELRGHEYDLEDLAHWTVGNAISVAKVDERYDLVMPFEVVGRDHKDVRARADAHVAALNGLGALFGNSFGGVEFASALYTIDESGRRRGAVAEGMGCQVRVRVGRVTAQGGQPAQDPTRGMAVDYMTAASAVKAAEDALTIVGRQNPTWSELYVAYELVEAAEGGRMVGDGWIDAKDLERFRHTVNNYNVLGVQARHGIASRAAPKNPMPHDEAKAVIRGLVGAWLRDLTTSVPGPS